MTGSCSKEVMRRIAGLFSAFCADNIFTPHIHSPPRTAPDCTRPRGRPVSWHVVIAELPALLGPHRCEGIEQLTKGFVGVPSFQDRLDNVRRQGR
jgi:hypothetical protein